MNFDGCFVNPKPVIGSIENPVIIHEVIVSGTFFEREVFDVLADGIKINFLLK